MLEDTPPDAPADGTAFHAEPPIHFLTCAPVLNHALIPDPRHISGFYTGPSWVSIYDFDDILPLPGPSLMLREAVKPLQSLGIQPNMGAAA
jgi:hypothetical protein